MKRILTRLAGIAVTATLALGAAVASRAEPAAFPSHVVKIVVPFSPGGSGDASARILGERLAEIWHQPVIIENKPGAGTTVASAYVAQSPPDGHTLYLAYILSYATSASLYSKLPYDPATALTPVSMVADAPFILAVGPGTHAKTLAQFMAIAQSAPEGLAYASTGIGSGPHLATEMFLRRAGIKAVHVPYRGTGDAMAALLGDQVQFSVLDAAALGQLQSGHATPLAVTSAKRWAQLPNVPTIAESGFPAFDVTSGSGIMVSSRTPADLVLQINAAVVKAMSSPTVQERFVALGFVPMSSTPQEFKINLDAQFKRTQPLLAELGLKLE